MIDPRTFVDMFSGRVTKVMWVQMLKAETRPIADGTCQCLECPMRRGGEWEEGATAAAKSPAVRTLLSRFVCHDEEGHCGGARRIQRLAFKTS